jgi:hypothetical protein
MAERKPLFLDSLGFPEEMATSDSATFGGLTLGGDVEMQGNYINDLGMAYVLGQALSYGQSGATLSGLDLDGNKLTNVAAGTVATDGVNFGQLLGAIEGLDVKESCRVATTADLGAAFDSSGGAEGKGQFTGAPTTIDGVSIAEGDRVLVKNQDNAEENGIYVVTSTTSTWDRAVDFDDDDEVTANAFTWVSEGNSLQDTGWVLVTNDPITVNTTEQAWTQFSSAGVIQPGDGLYQAGNIFHVGAGWGITANADDIEVNLADTDPGLEFDAQSGLKVQVVASGGIQIQSDGILLKIDDSPDTLDVDSDGLKVVGLPSAFKINDVATDGTYVTSANLDTLTDGSNADALHSHTGSSISLDHSELGNIGENDHHNRQHAITSTLDHSETGLTSGEVLTATGPTTFAWQTPPAADEAERLEVTYTAGANVTAGDPVRFSADDTVVPTDNALGTSRRTVGLARLTASSGNPVEVSTEGLVRGILAGATAGDAFFLDTPNGLTSTRPTAAGSHIYLMGFAANPTDLQLRIQYMGKVGS